MAVIEPQKEPRSVKAMLFIAALVLGFVALGGVIFWMVKPSAPRQVKLTGEQAKQQEQTFTPPTPVLRPAPPMPQAKDPGPTLVTLELKQVTPRQALMELAKQAKVNLRSDAGNQGGFLAALMSQRMDVSIKAQPFWPAMLDLCKKGKLTPYSEWNQPNQISLQQGNPEQAFGPTREVGSCLIVLDRVTSTFNADLVGTRPPGRDLNVQMRLFVEPKLSPYRISSVAVVETAVDENGTNLARPRNPWDDRSGGGPQSSWMKDVNCHLNFPNNAGAKIARLKGYASVAVAGPEQTKKVDNPLAAKNVDTDIDGVTVHLIDLRKGGGGDNSYTARLAGDMNSPIFKDYEKFSKIATLFDANGKQFQHSGGSWGGGRGGTFEFSLNFTAPRDASEPRELRFTVPTQLKEIRVPFEFTDLPLPH